jgi:hypothetical protein
MVELQECLHDGFDKDERAREMDTSYSIGGLGIQKHLRRVILQYMRGKRKRAQMDPSFAVHQQ